MRETGELRHPSGLALLGLFVASLVAAALVVTLLWPDWLDGVHPVADATAMALQYVVLLSLLVPSMRRSQLAPARVFGRSPRQPSVLWTALLTLSLILLSAGTLFGVLVPLSYVAPSYVEWALEGPVVTEEAPVAFALDLVTAIVLAPVAEEILFRGLLFRSWRARCGARRAAVFSSLCFGVLHADILGGFVFGYVMTLLFLETGTLRVPMLVHAANNGAVSLLMLFEEEPAPIETLIEELRAWWWLGPAALAVSVPLLVVLLRRRDIRLRPALAPLP